MNLRDYVSVQSYLHSLGIATRPARIKLLQSPIAFASTAYTELVHR